MRTLLLIATSFCLAASGCITDSSGPESQGGSLELDSDAGADCQGRELFDLTEVTCPACKNIVEDNLLAVKGVIGVHVTLEPQQADVQFCPDTIDADEISDVIHELGYGGTRTE